MKNHISYEILEGEELYEKLTDFNNLDYYSAKLSSAKDRLYYFDGGCAPSCFDGSKYIFFCAFHNDLLVGMLKFKVGGHASIWHPSYKNWVSHISIDRNYKNRKIGTELINMLFEYAEKMNYNILQSAYSKEGKEYISKVFIRVSEKHPNVDFKDDFKIL